MLLMFTQLYASEKPTVALTALVFGLFGGWDRKKTDH